MVARARRRASYRVCWHRAIDKVGRLLLSLPGWRASLPSWERLAETPDRHTRTVRQGRRPPLAHHRHHEQPRVKQQPDFLRVSAVPSIPTVGADKRLVLAKTHYLTGVIMVARKATDDQIIEAWAKHLSPARVAKALGLTTRVLLDRRRQIEAKTGKSLDVMPSAPNQHPKRLDLGILDGQIIVFSDAHFWPGQRTTAFKALLCFSGTCGSGCGTDAGAIAPNNASS